MQATQTVSAGLAVSQFPAGQSAQKPTSTILYGGALALDFDAGKHRYTVTDARGSREVPSVTTVLEVIGTSKWPLKQWAANMTADYIRAAIRPGLRYDEIQLGEIIDAARKNFHRVSQGAKTVGGIVHEWIEAHLRAGLYATPELPLPFNEQARKSIQAAVAWIDAHFRPLSMEHRLYSREHEYAGTLDVVGQVDGALAVVDWKTSRAIYEEMPLQAAAYALAWAEMYDERVPDRWVIRLDKDTGEFEPVKFSREDFRADVRGFLAAKALHARLEAMKAPKAHRPIRPATSGPDLVPALQASIAAAPARPRRSRQTSAKQQKEILCVHQNGALILSGATYPIKDDLREKCRAQGGKNGDGNYEWRVPAQFHDAVAALCAARNIRLVNAASSTASIPAV